MIRKMESFRIEHDKGFDISLETEEHLVTIKAWGNWDEALSRQFEREFRQKIERMPAEGEPWKLLMDLSTFSNHSKDIERTFSDILLFAKQRGMSQKAIVAKHIVMPHVLNGLAQDSELKINFFFQGRSDAVQWLLGA